MNKHLWGGFKKIKASLLCHKLEMRYTTAPVPAVDTNKPTTPIFTTQRKKRNYPNTNRLQKLQVYIK